MVKILICQCGLFAFCLCCSHRNLMFVGINYQLQNYSFANHCLGLVTYQRDTHVYTSDTYTYIYHIPNTYDILVSDCLIDWVYQLMCCSGGPYGTTELKHQCLFLGYMIKLQHYIWPHGTVWYSGVDQLQGIPHSRFQHGVTRTHKWGMYTYMFTQVRHTYMYMYTTNTQVNHQQLYYNLGLDNNHWVGPLYAATDSNLKH